MDLVQTRIVADDVETIAAFYAQLIGVPVTLNEYYVEVPTGSMSVGFSKRRFTEERGPAAACPASVGPRAARSSSTSWSTTSMPSTSGSAGWGSSGSCRPPPSPGGNGRCCSATPQGHLINVFSRKEVAP